MHAFEPKSALVWSVVSFSARPRKHLQESGEGKNGLIRMKSMSCIPSCSLCLDRRRLARVTSSPACPLTMQPVRWTQHNSWRNKTISRAICNFLNCAAIWKRFHCARHLLIVNLSLTRKWRIGNGEKTFLSLLFFVSLLFLSWLNKCFLISLEVMHVFAILCLNLHRCHCGKNLLRRRLVQSSVLKYLPSSLDACHKVQLPRQP